MIYFPIFHEKKSEKKCGFCLGDHIELSYGFGGVQLAVWTGNFSLICHFPVDKSIWEGAVSIVIDLIEIFQIDLAYAVSDFQFLTCGASVYCLVYSWFITHWKYSYKVAVRGHSVIGELLLCGDLFRYFGCLFDCWEISLLLRVIYLFWVKSNGFRYSTYFWKCEGTFNPHTYRIITLTSFLLCCEAVNQIDNLELNSTLNSLTKDKRSTKRYYMIVSNLTGSSLGSESCA